MSWRCVYDVIVISILCPVNYTTSRMERQLEIVLFLDARQNRSGDTVCSSLLFPRIRGRSTSVRAIRGSRPGNTPRAVLEAFIKKLITMLGFVVVCV